MPKLPTPKDDNSLLNGRGDRIKELLSWLRPVPASWITRTEGDEEDAPSVVPLPCSSFDDLLGYWRKAFRWRQDMDDVLSVMLAVSSSTMRQGDQLFLMVISNASGGKSEFCDGLTVSKHCYQLEQLTGFFSGVKDGEGNDYSLIKRVDKTCMVTSEGDVMMNNPQFAQIMAQQRRIFDGKASATYKNLLEDRFYEGLRLTWIIAGTHAIMEKDQASLGDRFLKIVMDSPDDNERLKIQNRISQIALDSVRVEAEGGATKEEKIREAQARTGGYVDWLRDNADKLGEIEVEEHFLTFCEDLARFVALVRARPPKREEQEVTVEEPNRLTHQYVRLMCCLSLVLNREHVDTEVMRRVQKVALDTGRGVVQDVVRMLWESPTALTTRAIAHSIERTDEATRKLMRFLRRIGLVQIEGESPVGVNGSFPPKKPTWELTPNMRRLSDTCLTGGSSYHSEQEGAK